MVRCVPGRVWTSKSQSTQSLYCIWRNWRPFEKIFFQLEDLVVEIWGKQTDEMREIYQISLCNENTKQIQLQLRKNEVWFDHFQMEFDLHIWWLSSPHEYFEMVEYQGDSPLRSDRTGNWLFLYQNAWFSKVIYIGKHYGFPHFCRFVFPKFRPPDLRAGKIFFQTVFNSVNFSIRTVCSVILKSKLAREHIEPSLQTVPRFGCKMWQIPGFVYILQRSASYV